MFSRRATYGRTKRGHVLQVKDSRIKILSIGDKTIRVEKIAQLPTVVVANPPRNAREEGDQRSLRQPLRVNCDIVTNIANFVDKGFHLTGNNMPVPRLRSPARPGFPLAL